MDYRTIKYDCGMDLTNKFALSMKDLDPSLTSIKIIMEGENNWTLSMEWPNEESK